MSSKLGIFLGLLLGLGVVFGLWMLMEPNEAVTPRSQNPASSPTTSNTDKTEDRSVATPKPPAPTVIASNAAGFDAAKLPTEVPQILAAIDDASVSYDPQELPKIQPYLLHPEPEVRKAALNGMLILGDAAASPMLRAAAQLATSPEEAVAMKQAADYLELPSGSILNAKMDKTLMKKKAKP